MTIVGRPQLHTSYVDLQQNELRNATLQNLGADIGSPVDGLIFYRTDTDRVRVRANGIWVDLATTSDAGAGIPATIVDVKGDLIAATASDAVARLAAGANGTMLFADSTETTGLEWRLAAPGDTNFAVTDRLLGRDTAGAGVGEEIAVTGGLEFTGSGGIQRSALTGNVTAPAGSNATTIAAGVVTLAMQANLAASSLIGNNTGSPATPLALTVAQAKTLLAIVPGDVTGFDTQVRLSRLDQMAAPTAPVGFGAQKITGLADGTAVTDAATFGQLNAVVTGQKWKDTVDAATTANITLSGTQTVDTVSLAVGDRVLVKDQSTASQNGLYVVAAGAWTRTTDADTATEINDATVLVDAGDLAVNKGDIYTQTATVATLGTDTVTWTKTGEGNTVYTADGTSLLLTGTVFSANLIPAANGGTGQSTYAVGDLLYASGATALSKLADVATGNALISGGVTTAPLWGKIGLTTHVSGTLAIGSGGTGQTTAAAALTALGGAKADETLIGDGAATSFVITHNRNTRAVGVSVYLASGTFEEIDVDVQKTSVNTVTVIFTGVVPTSNQYAVGIVG